MSASNLSDSERADDEPHAQHAQITQHDAIERALIQAVLDREPGAANGRARSLQAITEMPDRHVSP
jgi:hypothetical protein